MARFVVAAVVLCAACYTPQPPLGAPCDDTHPCPSGQACVAGFCGGNGGGADGSTGKGDGDSPDAAPTANDIDADGVPNASDNCPNTSNSDQGNEDGDPLGDKCDPCPIDAVSPPSDPDGDGVSDSCDPRPTTAGDSILVFEGFHAGVPSNWQVIGNVMQAGDDIVMVGVSGNRGALVPPITAPASGVVSARATITQTVGTFDSALAVVMPYDAGADNGIFCELYAPDAGSNNNKSLDIWDSIAQVEKAKTALAWTLNTPYTMTEKRTNNAYVCSANATTIMGSTSNPGSGTKAAVFTYGVTASVQWMMVVASP
jgi:hypothetical protein